MSDHVGLFVVIVVIVAIVIRGVSKLSGDSMTVLRATVGRHRRREGDMGEIARYWRRSTNPDDGIDDRTWADLDMDAVFTSLDHSESGVGQQLLYARLRGRTGDPAVVRQLDAAATRLGADESLRLKMAAALRPLADSRSLRLPALFEETLAPRPRFWWIFPLLTAAAIACLLLIDSYPRAALVLLAIAVVNLGSKYVLRTRIDPLAPALHMVPQLIRAGRTLAAVDCEELRDELAAVRASVSSLDRLYVATAWLAFEPGQTNEVLSTLYEYANLLFGFGVDAFVFGLEQIRAHRNDLRALFDAVGSIDTSLALSAWRETLPHWCRPEFTARRKAISVAAVVHPLIDRAVPNAFDVDRSVLVTGSNMSGKTTFIRALGVNAILAQTLGTAVASRWTTPWLDVRSSIGRSDDVQSGKSYYLAEVESIGALVSAARDGAQHLFLIDEIFRGTNTTERIAAGEAVLAWLDEGDNIVVVATHDLELLDALADRYAPYHFRERVEQNALLFDYVIRPGASSTRNAIALLRLMRFPEPLVRDALRAAERKGPSAAD
jgi:MutS-like protein